MRACHKSLSSNLQPHSRLIRYSKEWADNRFCQLSETERKHNKGDEDNYHECDRPWSVTRQGESEKEQTLQSKKVLEAMNWESEWDNKMLRWTYWSKGA